jgi:hypothetical protein
VTDPDAAPELALDDAFGGDLDIRTGTAKNVEESYPGPIESEILDFDLRARQTRRGDRPERGGREIAGYSDLEGP